LADLLNGKFSLIFNIYYIILHPHFERSEFGPKRFEIKSLKDKQFINPFPTNKSEIIQGTQRVPND